ncbi:DUF1433 domain-containing protein [Virgibacillus sp. 179-BFC.A HS]|uniref:DUF1433 domain-containing protein n=1 Tax=Tigheibacillus jepli TaxID=3035914 RepID=A0ABU5CCM4_9BACI|nr:DUF1433 domain-containing protein [Virgibacillus sp. 179-BFC.A HS]MDY0404068.1 DUF1433 domain-containing protein [Virgibacillus sp. 179-BFC.A HS]
MRAIYVFAVLSLIILLGGCFDSQKYDDATIEKAKKTVESYIRNNYEDIETVTFDDGDYSSPMGGMMIDGTVNGKAGFSASIDEESFEVGSMGLKKGFPPLKEECKKKICDY